MEAEESVLKYVTKAEYRKQQQFALYETPCFLCLIRRNSPIAHICGKGCPWIESMCLTSAKPSPPLHLIHRTFEQEQFAFGLCINAI